MANNDQPCRICGKTFESESLFPAELIRAPIARLIKKDYPEWDYKGSVCLTDLKHYRSIYLSQLIKIEKGETKSLEKDEKKSLEKYELISENINDAYNEKLTYGERLADKIDFLLVKQWQRLLEIQEFQTQLMEELVGSKGKSPR